ncbi:ATP-binding protein [Paenibacillus sp. PL2-23]|uniref:sensor histidine kinase n=1 Tax=Paenibacillus sp. PL2-23 TaxID=2100729 RepID=UPI0030F7B17A
MKLRTYLVLANFVSIALMLVILFVLFRYMLLTKEQLIWLGAAALGAGALSSGLYVLLVRPLEASVRRLREGASRIAVGDLQAKVEQTGFAEFQALARDFNAMAIHLERSFGQVKAAEKAQRDLVANMAHDLRTPLASMQSYAEALEDGVIQDSETFRAYIATIRNESVRLGELIQDVFELSTLEDAHQSEARLEDAEQTVVEDLLIELLPRFAPQMEARGVQLRVQAPEHRVAVRMASRHLARVLQNIIENAVRHSPEGGLILVEVEELGDGRVQLAITDEGEGVPEAERENIFERFYRLDRSRSRTGGGSGIGLSIAKLLVKQYGGDIGVEEAARQGSRFWLRLPEG